jgi:hypothetical protein
MIEDQLAFAPRIRLPAARLLGNSLEIIRRVPFDKAALKTMEPWLIVRGVPASDDIESGRTNVERLGVVWEHFSQEWVWEWFGSNPAGFSLCFPLNPRYIAAITP